MGAPYIYDISSLRVKLIANGLFEKSTQDGVLLGKVVTGDES